MTRPVPVRDLAAFLAGRWRIQRRLTDLLRNGAGRLEGTAVFTPDPAGLRCREQGTLSWGSWQGEAGRSYLYALTGAASAAVRFEDGRPFHPLDLSAGFDCVRHGCAPDEYEGLYRVHADAAWTLAWRISGPRKRTRIVTRYRRAT